MIIETGKIQNWVATKADLRLITAANPGADIMVLENTSVYTFTTPNDGEDDNDSYITLSTRSKGYWAKVKELGAWSTYFLIKGYGLTGLTPENGDWRLAVVDSSNDLYLQKRKANAWVNYEKYSY